MILFLYLHASSCAQSDVRAGRRCRPPQLWRAEINNGGDMVAEVLRQAEPNVPVRSVAATRGKYLRAEPVAAAYERGLVFHAGTFEKLEDQLCALTPDYDRRAGASPDRADALVWAIADLLGPDKPSTTGILDFWAGR